MSKKAHSKVYQINEGPEGDGASDTYTLDLPEEMCKRHINPKFHIRLLHQYEENDDILFPRWDTQVFYNVGQADEEEYFISEIIAHGWTRNRAKFLVKWNLGDST